MGLETQGIILTQTFFYVEILKENFSHSVFVSLRGFSYLLDTQSGVFLNSLLISTFCLVLEVEGRPGHLFSDVHH